MNKGNTKRKAKSPPASRRRTGPPADPREARSASSARKNRRRGGRRTLHHILVVLFLLAVGVVLSLTYFFRIEEVRVTGSDRYPAADITAFTGIQQGDNLFRVKTRELEKKLLEQFPYIESVRVKRTLPPAVVVEITPSVPVGAIVSGDGDEHILITRQGKILERGLLLLDGEIFLIKGVEAGNRQPGEYLGTGTGSYAPESRPSRDESAEDAASRRQRNADKAAHVEEEREALVMLEYLWQAMEATGFTDVTNVDLTDRLNMRVMYENRLTLLLGTEADLEDKLRFVQLAVEKLHPEARGSLNVADARSDRLIYAAADGYRREDGSPMTEPQGGGSESPEESGTEGQSG